MLLERSGEQPLHKERKRILLSISLTLPIAAHAAINLDFDTVGDLGANFNNDGSPLATEANGIGLGGSRAISIPIDSRTADDTWVHKTGEAMASVQIYSISGYFYQDPNHGNDGFGSIGFTAETSNQMGDSYSAGTNAIGVAYYGAGITFESDDGGTLSRPGSFQSFSGSSTNDGEWNFFEFTLQNTTGDTIALTAKSWDANADGTLGTFHGEKTETVVNASIANADTIYGYFGFHGNRYSAVDSIGGTAAAAVPEPSQFAVIVSLVVALTVVTRRRL